MRDCTQGPDIIQVGDSPGCDDGNIDMLRESYGGVDVDTREHAVARDVGIDDGLATIVFEFAGQIENVVAAELAPAIGRYLAITGIESDDDMPRESAAGVPQETGILGGSGADNDVGNSIVKILFDRVKIANPAADLDRNFVVDGVDNGSYGGPVSGLAGNCTVQIHQVEPAGSLIEPLLCHGAGVIGKNGGIPKVALAQAYTVPVLEVYGRDEKHDRKPVER